MRKPYAKITVKMVDEFVKLYKKDNMSCPTIAKKCNCSDTTVANYFRLMGVEVTRKKNYKKQEFYKKQFIICLYDLEDNLVGVFDNVHELSAYTKKPVNSLQCMLNPNRLHKKMRLNGKWYRKELIEVI